MASLFERSLAVIVGIGDYGELPRLRTAPEDAIALAKLLDGWCETQLRERGEYGLGEGGDAWKSLGWGWILRNAECRGILKGFWGLLGAASG